MWEIVLGLLAVATLCNYNLRVRFEWDEAKREANLRKHGIDFVGIEALFEGQTVTIEDDRLDYGEQRLIGFGILEGRVLTVVYTERPEVIRIISARKATRGEQERYFSTISN
jgi:uncharacterized DUF497 family protein